MSTSGKKWTWLVIFLIPVLLIFPGLNFLADPGNIFHNFSEEMSLAMLDGQSVQVSSNNLDDREVLQHLIENMPDRIDAMVWGSSIALCIDSEMTGEENFFNMAVSASDFYDLMACMALMELNGKQAERVILALDSRFFDPGIYMTDGRHDRLMEYSEYMMDILNNEVPDMLPEPVGERSVWSRAAQLFSVSYFQWSVEYLKTNGIEVLTADRWQIVDGDSTVSRYLPDYSMVYAKAMEDVTLDAVTESCRTYWLGGNITEYASMDAGNCAFLEKLIRHLQEQECEVEVILTPYAPSLWDRIEQSRYPILSEVESYVAYLETTYGITVQGSFNPHNMDMTDEDFYDARHVKKSSLKAHYDLTD